MPVWKFIRNKFACDMKMKDEGYHFDTIILNEQD